MRSNLFGLEGKIAIVTGALGLIGKNHCRALAEAGANVVVADISETDSMDFCSSLPTDSVQWNLDVTDKNSIERLKEKTIEKYGRIDILVNNAAINDMFENPKSTAELSMFENYPLELWQKSIDVNLTGVFLCSQIIGKHMADSGSGCIINIASTYGLVAPDQSLYVDKNGNQNFYKSPAYPVTKGGVIMLTKYLAAYWGSKGVRVNTLSPGGVKNSQDEFFVSKYAQKTPLGRMANADDYKGALIFLASDASSYMTGANLVIDGGWTIW